ncbi:CRISPR-Cas system-associated integrase Cas1 (Cas1) [Fructobacillus cardui]|nr:CRISPR-Cas system-associated integrase Cas1 (Cas1) [Fructobacillus cardui]
MAWRTILINEHAKINFKMNDINVQTKNESFQIPIDDIRILIGQHKICDYILCY